MSRTFAELQVVQEVLEGCRSRRTPLPITDTEREVVPEGDAYSGYPPLDRARLREGYTMCIGNATRLIAGASVLRDAGQCRNACLILSLALEELGAAIQVYEAGRAEVEDWAAWWSRYFTHPKRLESRVLDLPRTEEADEPFALVREELLYVDFDTDDKRFIAPREDDDRDLPELFGRQAAFAEAMLRAMPTHAFERWEIKDMVAKSPGMAPWVLYARIEELLAQEPSVSERDLLFVIAQDVGRPSDDFAAGFERWKKVAPQARVYMDLLRRVQDRLKTERETDEAQ